MCLDATEKRCSKCGCVKPLELFHRELSTEDGRARWCKECKREHRIENTEAYRAAGRRCYWKDPAKAIAGCRKSQIKYADRVRKTSTAYCRKRRQTDPAYRLANTWRSRIGQAIRNYEKSDSSENLLGCSWDQFLGHLELRFEPGMCWDNYGQWHVDHIRPLARFDLSKPEEQRAALHWSNHQPLWAKDNLSKGAKI